MKIVFIGDSITDAEHNYTADRLGKGYVKIIADSIGEKYPQAEIVNKGHDGFTVFGLWRFLEHDCILQEPDIVSVLIGCNDVSIKMNTGKTLEEQEFQKTYEKILRRIRTETEAQIVCMGPFIFPYPEEFANWIPDMKKAEEMARMAAEKYGARFVPLHDILMEKAVKEGYEKITTDGTHLTTGGASVIAEKWLDVTANWLDKQGEIS